MTIPQPKGHKGSLNSHSTTIAKTPNEGIVFERILFHCSFLFNLPPVCIYPLFYMAAQTNPYLVYVLPPFCDWSVGSGFELHLRWGGDVVQGLWNHGRVILGSDVNPAHWCMRAWSQLPSGDQRTCPYYFCVCGWCVLARYVGKRIFLLVWTKSSSSPEIWRARCSGWRAA